MVFGSGGNFVLIFPFHLVVVNNSLSYTFLLVLLIEATCKTPPYHLYLKAKPRSRSNTFSYSRSLGLVSEVFLGIEQKKMENLLSQDSVLLSRLPLLRFLRGNANCLCLRLDLNIEKSHVNVTEAKMCYYRDMHSAKCNL